MAKQNEEIIAQIKKGAARFKPVEKAYLDLPIAIGTSIPSQSEISGIFINTSQKSVYQRSVAGWQSVSAFYWYTDDSIAPIESNIQWAVEPHTVDNFAINAIERFLRNIHFDGETEEFNSGQVFLVSSQLEEDFKKDFMTEAIVILPLTILAEWITDKLGKKKSGRKKKLEIIDDEPPLPSNTGSSEAPQELPFADPDMLEE